MGRPVALLFALVGLAGLATCAPHPEVAGIELPPSRIGTIAVGFDPQLGETVDLDLERACPAGMVRVTGGYCPDVEHRCLRWLDPPGKYHAFRCAEYATEPVCRAPRKAMSFCIDRDEQKLAGSHDERPSNHVSYLDAKSSCTARGARLCTQPEWQFACEGEEMRPYPYGFVRDATACNIDRTDLGRPGAGLRDFRTKTGENPRCESPFGVRDLAGNLEEWVAKDPKAGGKSTLLKGSWWLPGKSTCRATNAGHDAVYQGPETGFRCCK